MGCCDNKSGCKSKQKKSIPWFTLIIVLLAVLVVVNWQ